MLIGSAQLGVPAALALAADGGADREVVLQLVANWGM
jgi:hypothetical protein